MSTNQLNPLVPVNVWASHEDGSLYAGTMRSYLDSLIISDGKGGFVRPVGEGVSVKLPSKINPKLYTASRASIPERSLMWRNLRRQGWDIISTWIDEAGEGETENFTELWYRIGNEIKSCDGLIFYAEKADFPLKGALVEVGMALGMGKPVGIVLVGVQLEGRTQKPLGSFLFHPSCKLFNSLKEAREWIAEVAPHFPLHH